MTLPYDKNRIENARALRKNATPQENHLWYDFLRKYPLRFQRQKTIGQYIVDFYCHSARLVIEIDGGQHFTDDAERHDASRTSVLNKYGLEVLRFSNREINLNFREVCEKKISR